MWKKITAVALIFVLGTSFSIKIKHSKSFQKSFDDACVLDLSGVNFDYKYSNYYFSNMECQDLKYAFDKKTKCSNDEILNKEIVYQNIINNSNKYENSFFKQSNIDGKSIFKKAFYNSFSSPGQLKEDLCKLNNLAIVASSELEKETQGLYQDSNCLITVDVDKIKKHKSSAENYLTNVLWHEIDHAKEYMCNDRQNKSQYVSLSATKTFKMLHEAAAESVIHEYSSAANNIYQDYRLKEGRLLMMVAFSENKNLDQYYEAIYNTDLLALLDFFEVNSEKELKNFLNINYNFDAQTGFNDLGKARSERKIGSRANTYIFREVLEKLAINIINDKMTIKEASSAYNFSKNLLKASSEMKNIQKMEDIFLDFVLETKGWDKEEFLECGKFYNFEDMTERYPVLKYFQYNDLNVKLTR